MTKYITVIAVAVLFSFSGKAYCWSLNDIQNTVQQAASSVTKNASAGTSNNNTAQPAAQQQAASQPAAQQQAVQPQQPQDASQDNANLEKGVYGVPFKADLATVLKWCEDNKVDIKNFTKEQVEDKARDLLRKIKDIKNNYEDQKSSLSSAEQDVAAITTDPSIDAMEKMAAAQAQQMLETLKNPSVDYDGKTYLLDKKLSGGIQVEGVDKPCMDKRITDAVFSLTVSPSAESQSLLNQSLSSIEIYFFKDESGIFSSYSTVATFANDSDDEIRKQYGMLSQVLTQKYGNPSIMGQFPSGSVQWRKNISLQGDIRTASDTHLLTLFGNSFIVYYFEPETLNKVTTLQAKVVEDFKNAQANEDANKAKSMQNNF